jgi:serine/threonine-protein kinase
LMVPLLRALQAAHDAGVIHRDIKAANVFLHSPPSGPTVPKLLDFGVAKILHPQSSDAPSSAPDTGVGLAVGTPVYMSPEQVRCEPLDARSDVYQAGDLLYRMLTGRGPFDRHRTAGRITEARLSERPPRPSAVMAAALPRPLEDVILRSLELEPAKRFQSAGALAEALTRWMESPSARAGREWRRTASNCARSRCWVVLALVVFALGAAVGCWWL